MTAIACEIPVDLCETAHERFTVKEGRPLFLCDWARALFIHYEVDADALQREVPYALDLHEGKAYVSLVAFTMENLRPERGGRFGRWAFTPIAAHSFMNVRTYVKHRGETGIYFLLEWVPNRLSVLLGPATFGLPYRFGRLDYRNHHDTGNVDGCVSVDRCGATLSYRAETPAGAHYAPCERGTASEFLLERYTAFTSDSGTKLLFRVWHKPWPQIAVDAQVDDESLLAETFGWFGQARRAGANYSTGVEDVWIGFPHRAGDEKLGHEEEEARP